MEKKGLSNVLRCWTVILLFYLCQDVYGLKVLDVKILSDSNHTYLLHEEYGVITCEFELKNGTDVLESVHWSTKRGDKIDEFYIWKRDTRPVLHKGVFKGRVDMRERNPHKLVITSASIEMHGEIKCEVKTKKDSDSKERLLVIVQDTCKESDWQFNLDEKCGENVHFQCQGFFPKPIYNCGLYNRIAQSYINSIPLSVTTRRDNTYDVSATRHFEASEFIKHGDVALRCEIIIYGADYKFMIEKQMFGEKGCPSSYPSASEDVNATSIVETCWNRPANGSVITYLCEDDMVKTITCIDGEWVDESEGVISDQFCDGSIGLYAIPPVFLVVTEALIFFMW